MTENTATRRQMIMKLIEAQFKGHTDARGVALDLEAMTDQVEETTQDCFLCKEPSYALGMFKPNDPVQFGSRVCFYGSCKDCLEKPNMRETFENALLAQLKSQLH